MFATDPVAARRARTARRPGSEGGAHANPKPLGSRAMRTRSLAASPAPLGARLPMQRRLPAFYVSGAVVRRVLRCSGPGLGSQPAGVGWSLRGWSVWTRAVWWRRSWRTRARRVVWRARASASCSAGRSASSSPTAERSTAGTSPWAGGGGDAGRWAGARHAAWPGVARLAGRSLVDRRRRERARARSCCSRPMRPSRSS